MKREQLVQRRGFHVGVTTRRAQVAMMTLAPRGQEGGPDNRHRGAEQWLYVIEGTGRARVNGRAIRMRKGTLVLIERGDRHEIRNTGRGQLKTVNFYTPAAYRRDGEPLPGARAS